MDDTDGHWSVHAVSAVDMVVRRMPHRGSVDAGHTYHTRHPCPANSSRPSCEDLPTLNGYKKEKEARELSNPQHRRAHREPCHSSWDVGRTRCVENHSVPFAVELVNEIDSS